MYIYIYIYIHTYIYMYIYTYMYIYGIFLKVKFGIIKKYGGVGRNSPCVIKLGLRTTTGP